MKKLMFALWELALALLASSAHAIDFPVQGTGVSGRAGDRVYVELIYNYGASFGVIAEDLQFEYQFANMTFVPAASTIDVFGLQNLLQYANSLGQFAQAHQGSVLVNLNAPGSAPDYKGYALSFFTADGVPHVRSGIIRLVLAFDILAAAPLGVNRVSFPNTNVLFDQTENEFRYPSALQNLNVTVTDVKIDFVGTPALITGQFRADFRVTNFRPGMIFRLEKKSTPRDLAWTTDSAASSSVVVPNSVFRFSTPAGGGSQSFYRVVEQ